jgi:hypothetical protein
MQAFTLPDMLIEEVKRPRGYNLDGHTNVRASADGFSIDGFGSGDLSVAREKAISEWIERYVLLATKGGPFKSPTSNGWAAHCSLGLALEAATYELVERDSALRAWFERGPFYEIPESLWPPEIQRWSTQSLSLEFSKPKITICLGPHGACVSAFIMNKFGGAVIGHASSCDLGSAIRSAFSEALRSAHAALRLDAFAEVVALHSGREQSYCPNANALAYAYGVSLPELRWTSVSESSVETLWKEHRKRVSALNLQTSFKSYRAADRIVVSVYCPSILELFWGPTPAKFKAINPHPHFVG